MYSNVVMGDTSVDAQVAGPLAPTALPEGDAQLASVKHVSSFVGKPYRIRNCFLLQQILTFSLNFLKKKKDNMINLF